MPTTKHLLIFTLIALVIASITVNFFKTDYRHHGKIDNTVSVTLDDALQTVKNNINDLTDLTDNLTKNDNVNAVANHTTNNQDDAPYDDIPSEHKVVSDNTKKVWQEHTVNLTFKYFTLNYSCSNHGYNYSHYATVPDTGNYKRLSKFHLEPLLNKEQHCENQKNTYSYRRSGLGYQYDRGHGVHQNIWDHDKTGMYESNSMVNIVPQERTQNQRGLWRTLEKRVECARDKGAVEVWVGNIWGTNTHNDYFWHDHGVKTPDYLWRIHRYLDSNTVFAWIIPNDPEANANNEAKYRTSIKDIQQQADFVIDLPKNLVDTKQLDPYKNIRCNIQ